MGCPKRLCQAFSEAQLVAPVDGTRCRLGDQGEDNFEGASNEAVERGQEVVQPDGRGPPPERLLIGAKIGLTGEDLSGWPVADPIRAVVVDLPAPGPGRRLLAKRRWSNLPSSCAQAEIKRRE